MTVAQIIGPEMCQALSEKEIIYDSASLWAGAMNTRTPLHVDNIDGLVIQIAGTKRFFLTSEDEVEQAVNKGLISEDVLTHGKTDNFLKEGTIGMIFWSAILRFFHYNISILDSVFGLREKSPSLCTGEVATLNPGDCLLLPAGL